MGLSRGAAVLNRKCWCGSPNASGAKNVTRLELIDKILQPGPVHPWRKAWLETWRDCQLEVAELITTAIRRNAPGETCVGLMSSAPGVHTSEGRDWPGLFAICGADGPIVHRPHFAPYGETPGICKVYSIIALDSQKQLRPDYCQVTPEIENHPFTNWRKSDTQSWCEMSLATFYGANGLFLDLHPHSGRPDEVQIGRLLDKSRASLTWISQKFSRDFHTRGVGIPWGSGRGQLHTNQSGAVHDGIGDGLL